MNGRVTQIDNVLRRANGQALTAPEILADMQDAGYMPPGEASLRDLLRRHRRDMRWQSRPRREGGTGRPQLEWWVADAP